MTRLPRRCRPLYVDSLVVTDRLSVVRDGVACIRRITVDQLRALAYSRIVNCTVDRRNAWLAAELIGRPLPPPREDCPEDVKHILLLPPLILLTYL
jgi:hypothetical protein